MLQEIYKSRGEISVSKEKEYSRKKSTFFNGANLCKDDFQNFQTGKCTWPESEPVVFNFRLP